MLLLVRGVDCKFTDAAGTSPQPVWPRHKPAPSRAHSPHTWLCAHPLAAPPAHRGRAGDVPPTCNQHRVHRPAQGLAVVMHPGVPVAPRPTKPCRHGPAVLSPPSRGSCGLGTIRARVFGMALPTFAGSRCTHGGGADMTWQVAGSSVNQASKPHELRGRSACSCTLARSGFGGSSVLLRPSHCRYPASLFAVLSDAAMAAALAGFSGRAEPFACYASFSSAGGGSVVLVGARNGCGTLERMHVWLRSDELASGPRDRARSREITGDACASTLQD